MRASTLLALVLALSWAAPCGAGLVKRGRPAFEPESMAVWEGRTVEAVDIQGHESTREDLIRRLIRTAVGQPLDAGTVAEDVARLVNLGAFADVRAHAAEVEPGGGVRVTFVLSETYKILPVPALLYTEENGWSVGAGVSATNLGGKAMKLGGKAFFGGTRQYWVTFDAPWLYGRNHHRSFTAFLAKRDRPDELRGFHEDSYEVHPSFGRHFGDDRGKITVGLTYFQMLSDQPGITLSPDDSDHWLQPAAAVTWDTRDDWQAPRRGWRNELELTRSLQAGGGAAFWRLNADLRRWVPTAARQKLLLSSLLTMQSGDLGTDVPVYFDFYVGGANSVRGYEPQDRPLSGKNQLLGTAEYSLVLLQPRQWDIAFLSIRLGLEAAVFADGGLVWTRGPEFALDRTRGGVGAGLRLLVPGTEMMRLDFGWSEQQGIHFHFASGSKPVAQRQRLR